MHSVNWIKDLIAFFLVLDSGSITNKELHCTPEMHL